MSKTWTVDTYDTLNLNSYDNIVDLGGPEGNSDVAEVMAWLSQFPPTHYVTYDGSDLVVMSMVEEEDE